MHPCILVLRSYNELLGLKKNIEISLRFDGGFQEVGFKCAKLVDFSGLDVTRNVSVL